MGAKKKDLFCYNSLAAGRIALAMDNKRQLNRQSITKEVIINNLLTGRALDISREGMFINVPADIRQNSSITLKLHINGRPVVVKAVVRHSQPGVGIGVQFVDMNESKEDLIDEFIEQCRRERKTLEKQGGEQVVLMVDDRPESIRPFERQLALAGYRIITAHNGIEAVKKLDENKVDLVITDLLMDRMNGFMLINLIKQTKKFSGIPVAVLSATNRGDADIERASALGIERFFMKHITKPQAFAEEVDRILKAALSASTAHK